MKALAPLAVALALAVGCGSDGRTATDKPGSLEIATQQAADAGGDALLEGELVGHVIGDAACFYLEQPGGRSGMLIWPPHWSAADDPLRVLDASGNTAATVGNSLSFAAGMAPFTGDTPCPRAEHAVFVSDEDDLRAS